MWRVGHNTQGHWLSLNLGLEERTHSFPQQIFIEHLPSISQEHEIEQWAKQTKIPLLEFIFHRCCGGGGEHQQANQLLTCQVVCKYSGEKMMQAEGEG